MKKSRGLVIDTNPTAGTKVSKDTEITMQVSKGSEKITVPNVVGKTRVRSQERDHRSRPAQFLLLRQSIMRIMSEGQVIRQDPASGKVEKGTSVSLVVSLGKKPETKLTVPNVVNVSEASARQMISNAGLTVSDTTYISSDTGGSRVALSVVVLVLDREVSKGTGVSLVISTGSSASGGNTGNEQ